MIDIAVMGHGTVGSGVVEVLLKNAEIISYLTCVSFRVYPTVKNS